jgi:hypothetical protein
MGLHNCSRCVHRRGIISENGFHFVCCLSWQAARKCVLGIKSRYVELPKFAWKNEDGK